MKQYTGTKVINAEPMTLGEYNNFRGWNLPDNEDALSPGYLVEYTDGGKPNVEGYHGYVSWSPKDVFDKSYRLSETYVDRLYIERGQLSERFSLLSSFLITGDLKKLKSDYQAGLLRIQREFMSHYLRVLDERIDGEDGIDCLVMSFGMAIEALRYWMPVYREGWNGKGMFVVKQIPAHINESVIPKMQSIPQSAKDIIMKRDNKEINYTSQMFIIQPDGRADSWVPSVSDIFATDWKIFIG